jgi:hypothetical protein
LVAKSARCFIETPRQSTAVQEVSFLDLVEVRFVEHFREVGVKVRTLRRALEAAPYSQKN